LSSRRRRRTGRGGWCLCRWRCWTRGRSSLDSGIIRWSRRLGHFGGVRRRGADRGSSRGERASREFLLLDPRQFVAVVILACDCFLSSFPLAGASVTVANHLSLLAKSKREDREGKKKAIFVGSKPLYSASIVPLASCSLCLLVDRLRLTLLRRWLRPAPL
jgi:hypothetical protein